MTRAVLLGWMLSLLFMVSAHAEPEYDPFVDPAHRYVELVRMTAAAWLPDSGRIVTAGGGKLFVWNAADGRVVDVLENPHADRPVSVIVPDRDGRHVEITLKQYASALYPELCGGGCRDSVDENVFVLDLHADGGAPTAVRDRLGEDPPDKINPIVSPDHHRVLAPDASGNLAVSAGRGTPVMPLRTFLPRTYSRIVGGVRARIGDAPWQVELIWTGYAKPSGEALKHPDRLGWPKPHHPTWHITMSDWHRCGGVLIAADWVLTAAHCVTQEGTTRPLPTTQLLVRGGAVRLGDPAMREVPIVGPFIVHHRYVPSTNHTPPRNDVALVHLSKPMPLSVLDPRGRPIFKPIGLADPSGPAPTYVTVTGWGASKPSTFAAQAQRVLKGGFLKMDDQLQVARLTLAAEAKCVAQLRRADRKVRVRHLAPTLFCAGAQPGGLHCLDGGGSTVGVVGWAKGCDDGPGAYVGIGPSRDWIAQTGAGAKANAAQPATCQGDSGGPLVATGPKGQPVLVGLVGWAPGCGYAPGVYTSAAPFKAWIQAKLARFRD